MAISNSDRNFPLRLDVIVIVIEQKTSTNVVCHHFSIIFCHFIIKKGPNLALYQGNTGKIQKNDRNHDNSVAVAIFPKNVGSFRRVCDRDRDKIANLPNGHLWRYNHVTSIINNNAFPWSRPKSCDLIKCYLLQQAIKSSQIFPVHVCRIADQIVTVVTRFTNFLAVTPCVTGPSVLHAAVATPALNLG